MTTGDWINAALLLVALIGIGFTYWQVRASGVTQRAAFLKDLYSTFTADADICEAYYQVEYGQFSYGPEFHGSPLERKIDRLLAFANLVCELHAQKVISAREIEFFRYRLLRLVSDSGIQQYLAFLQGVYQNLGANKVPFHSFQAYSRKLLPH